MESTNERGHFLTDVQKRVKQEIMEKIMDGIFDTLHNNIIHFQDSQSILDLLFSILVMTNREVLIRIILSAGAQIHTKKILKDLFRSLEEELMKRIDQESKEMH